MINLLNDDMARSKYKRQFSFLPVISKMAKRKPLGFLGFIIVLFMIFLAIFAPYLSPYGMNEMKPIHKLEGPSKIFWFGTDNLGRDLFTRIIYGARISVILGVFGAALAVTVSVIVGVLSGYFGGWIDLFFQRIVDAVMCFPVLVFLMLLISLMGTGLWNLIFAIGIRWGITGSRVVRNVVLSLKENEYIITAKTIGCSDIRILFKHILPNITPSIIVLFSVWMPNIVLTEASLSYLGFGIPPPAPSWGGMISSCGRQYMFVCPWIVLWPGLALSLLVFGANIFGDALRDILDPKLKTNGL